MRTESPPPARGPSVSDESREFLAPAAGRVGAGSGAPGLEVTGGGIPPG